MRRIDQGANDRVFLCQKKDERDLSDGTPCGTKGDCFVVHGARDDGVGKQECEDEDYVSRDDVDAAEGRGIEEDPSFEDEGLGV